MPALFRKILPVSNDAVVDDDDDDYNVEYSFALEYKGPPVSYAVPQIVPVNIDNIPTASVLFSASSLNKLAIPVIQPIEKHNRFNKFTEDSNLGGEALVSLCEPTDRKESVGEGRDQVLSSELVDSGTFDGLNVDGLSHNSSVGADLSGVLGVTSDVETKPHLLDGRGSSGSLGYLPSFHDSRDSSRRSNAPGLLDDDKEEDKGVELQDCINPTDDICVSADLTMTSRTFSSDNSIRMEHSENETPHHVSVLPAVNVHDPEHDIVSKESDHEEVDIVPVRQQPIERKEKKSSCYRCGKGNRFTEKESCLVCGANFCGDCVLRVMGSMQEGRKCITCVGLPINESKRSNLGKSSRMLKRLLTEVGAKQIMKQELLSKANQLQPEVVYVNDKPLCQEEIVRLQSCPNPPKKLKPGHYWYDTGSGFWGKKGQKPCQVISPGLKIGDRLKPDASNGNTNVSINNRVITKVELRMLQFAGVECEGNPEFWMKDDGSIKEQGMKNERGRIWDKRGMRLFCAILSLPTPPEDVHTVEEEGVNLLNRDVPVHPDEKNIHKLLLVGSSKSGTSTIFKQVKLLYNVPFNGDDRENIKLIVQTNLYNYLGILLEGRQRFEEEISMNLRKRPAIDHSNSSGNVDENDEKTVYSLGPRLKDFSDWFLQVKKAGNLESIFLAATREYAPIVAELWKSAAIQATYDRINELTMLPRVASYFLNRAVEILRTEYEPSDSDIMLAEGFALGNGPAAAEFSFQKSLPDTCIYQHDQSLRYELIRVHLRNLGGNYKWLNMFEDVEIVLFCVNLTDYDQLSYDGNGSLTNKMLETRNLFESIVTHPTFRKKEFLLILNKSDLFEEKINQVPLNRCDWFSEFNPLISHHPNSDLNISSTNPSLAQRAFHYIGGKFKNLFKSLTGLESERKLYVSIVTALEPDTVDKALRYGREILKWNEEKENFISSDVTSYSIDASTTQFSQ